ncbi:unnamed protein product [Kluyveromyces dobzhanskii CBS 2104]|uniref:WGS project CCBQ000000000 data, contig 00107 n=1 Tax=Kluyveromyces dobzhanskii CBS 2104 TaxID=1427455 RepID=A0A0A8L1H7_9SACH|nr:unnamed protein product [Kluyveromyces dobzhanskii CBS 2104]
MAKKFTFGFATLLVFLQCVALAFLILACVSAPVFDTVRLASFDGVYYGVFGYCQDSGASCSSAQANYHPETLDDDDSNWKMNNSAREALANILIVTPVAAGLTFIALITSFMCQFRFFDSSTFWFIMNFLFSILAFLSSALVCIVVMLLFFPHVTWYAYVLIVSAVFNLVCLPICFFARSQTASNRSNNGLDEDEDGDRSSSSIRDKFYQEEFNQTDLTNFDAPSMPDYYKGSKIVQSNTLNSNTVTDSDVPSSYVNSTGVPVPPQGPDVYQRNNNNNDASYLHNAVPKQPYSAINNNGTSLSMNSASKAMSSGRITASLTERSNSFAPSSVYNEQVTGVAAGVAGGVAGSQQPRGNNASSQAPAQGDLTQPAKTQQDVLQDIINGALSEDEEEFLKQNTVDPSERPAMETFDEDYDGLNDDDSQFTSVSQRGINPNYYHGRAGVQYAPPSQGPLQSNLQGQVQGQGVGPSGLNPAQQSTGGQYYPPPSNQGVPQQGYYYAPPMQQQQQQRPPYSAGPSASDFLLQSNPEFALGGRPSSYGNNQRTAGLNSAPTSSLHYKPAYKKRLPRKANLPPASISRDGPYGGF